MLVDASRMLSARFIFLGNIIYHFGNLSALDAKKSAFVRNVSIGVLKTVGDNPMRATRL